MPLALEAQRLNKWTAREVQDFFFFFLIFIYLVAPGLSCQGISIFSCSIWDLVPQLRVKLRPLAVGAWSLSHWTTREVPSF